LAASAQNVELMEGLREARREGLPWHTVGRLLQKRFERSENWGRRTDIWDEAGGAAGLAPVVLKRFLVIMNKLDRVSVETGIPPAALVSPSYGAVELALRLYDRDAGLGLHALSELRERRMTIEGLQKILSETPAGSANPSAVSRSVSLRERATLVKHCEDALSQNTGFMFGPGTTIVRRPILKHFRRIGFEILDGSRILGGADLHLLETAEGLKDSPEGLAQSLLLAHYLPIFYLAFAPGVAAGTVESAEQALDALGMAWVGIITIDASGAVKTARRGIPNDASKLAAYADVKTALTIQRRLSRK
jgi:DNA-binding transcriptional MerR regulator